MAILRAIFEEGKTEIPVTASFPYKNTIRLKDDSTTIDIKLTDEEIISLIMRNKMGQGNVKG